MKLAVQLITLGNNQVDFNLIASVKCKLSSPGSLRVHILFKSLQVHLLHLANQKVPLDMKSDVATDIYSRRRAKAQMSFWKISLNAASKQGKSVTMQNFAVTRQHH
jgi:hypothetical protein